MNEDACVNKCAFSKGVSVLEVHVCERHCIYWYYQK